MDTESPKNQGLSQDVDMERNMAVVRIAFEHLALSKRAIILGLCHYSGWSADRISLTILENFCLEFTCTELWDIHNNWFICRSAFKKDEHHMKKALQNAGYVFTYHALPLSEQSGGRPVHVQFKRVWDPRSLDSEFCGAYTGYSRRRTKGYFLTHTDPLSEMYQFSPEEEEIMKRLGKTVTDLIFNSLNQGIDRLRLLSEAIPWYKTVAQEAQLVQVREQLRLFTIDWQGEFGALAENGEATQSEYDNGLFIVNSCGQGHEALLGLMLIDRADVIDEYRKRERRRIGSMKVAPVAGEPCEECPICREELNKENDDGVTEHGVRIVYCCSNVFGNKCLALWSEGGAGTCPMCNTKLPEEVVEQLIEGGFNEGEDDGDSEDNFDEGESKDVNEDTLAAEES